MKKIIQYWNQNRLKIIIILIIIVFIFALIYTTNIILSQSETNEINENTAIVNYTGPTESVVTGEEMTQDQTQMVPTLNQFIDYCNEQKIEEAYALLSDECKEELYPQLADFQESYYNQVFGGQKKNVNIENWVGNIYRIEINDDFLATGIYNKDNTIQDYITITIDGNGNNKLNINGYVGREEIDKTNNYENIEITALRSNSYMNYETYTFRIVNNSENEILLDSSSMYIEDENETRYSVYTHELSIEELTVGPKQTKEVTVKYYNQYGSTKIIERIVFERIILNNDVSEARKYGELQIEL